MLRFVFDPMDTSVNSTVPARVLCAAPALRHGSEETTNNYRETLLQRGEELLQVTAMLDRCMQERENNSKDHTRADIGPDFLESPTTRGADVVPHDSSADSKSFAVVCGGREKNVGEEGSAVGADPTTSAPQKRVPSLSAVKNKAAPAPVVLDMSPLTRYKNLLERQNEELGEAAVSFERYTTEVAKRFKRPPVILPAHLVNDFTDTNVIEARDHKGRLDIFFSLAVSNRDACRIDRGVFPAAATLNTTTSAAAATVNTAAAGSLLQVEENDEFAPEQRSLGPFLWGDNVAEQQEQQQLPRFTLHSLPNGDLRERDALSGWAYWDAEAPVTQRRVLPSRLLDEREGEAFHNYRFYSRRWGVLLRELAAAVGGEEGARLMHRYETRELSQPLPLNCRRDFYESVVDYDTLLAEQERIVAAVEQDLARHYAHERLKASPSPSTPPPS